MRLHRHFRAGDRAGGGNSGCGAGSGYSSAGSLRCGSQRTAAVSVCLRLLENWRLPTHRLRTGLLRLSGPRLLSVRMPLRTDSFGRRFSAG